MEVTPIIVVPVYKGFDSLKAEELISFKRLLEILGKHPIKFFGPADMNFEAYRKFASTKGVTISFEAFDKDFFDGVASYSKLMLSKEFYKRFGDYSHMLIYQLDAYVFSDQLLYWCSQPYDYIGAPWIEDKSGKHITGKITGLGNGGFCLRYIPKMIEILTSDKPFKSFGQLVKEYKNVSAGGLFLRYPKILYRSITGHRNTGLFYAERFFKSEDAFWCQLVSDSKYKIRLPSVPEAIKFSFEVAPEQLYKMNNYELPFGCHAWYKHQPGFWKKFIDW